MALGMGQEHCCQCSVSLAKGSWHNWLPSLHLEFVCWWQGWCLGVRLGHVLGVGQGCISGHSRTGLVWFQAHGCRWALPAPPGTGTGQVWHLQAAL